jgi:hypothetical protein
VTGLDTCLATSNNMRTVSCSRLMTPLLGPIEASVGHCNHLLYTVFRIVLGSYQPYSGAGVGVKLHTHT